MSIARQDAQVLFSVLTFRTLLDALARPGTITQLPISQGLHEAPAEQLNMAALSALLTLLDRETSFVVASLGSWLAQDAPLVRWIALHSGAHPTTPDQAAFALLCDAESIELLTQLQDGTLLEPESSATAFCCLEQLVAESGRDDGLTLELRGPGIETARTLAPPGLTRAQVTALTATRRRYPLGIDVYLIDVAGYCVGLPRTTRIKLVEERSV